MPLKMLKDYKVPTGRDRDFFNMDNGHTRISPVKDPFLSIRV